MGNASRKEGQNGHLRPPKGSGGDRGSSGAPYLEDEKMGTSPPDSPHRSRSPLLFGPQAPVAPIQRTAELTPTVNPTCLNNSHVSFDAPPVKGIPSMITWSYGGNEVLIEGSWDNWTSRKALQRSGKDHFILLVLPLGVYHYKFIVDGECRHIPDFPFLTDEIGQTINILDVNDYLPENPESISEFQAPLSPDSSYSQPYPVDEDFAKDPPALPPQLHLTVLGSQHSEDSSEKPQHVVLNHLFIEKGWAPQSLVALGMTHRFQSKYVTVVLYKPMRRN